MIGDTAANRKWNDVTLARIRRVVTTVPPIIASKRRMILQEVVNQINLRLKDYLILTDDGKGDKDLVHLVIRDDVPQLLLKNASRIVKKKDFKVPVCIPQPQKQADLEPPFAVYLTKTHLVVRIEVPGTNSLDKIKWAPKQGMLEIQGMKSSVEDVEGSSDIQTILDGKNPISSGSWHVLINLRLINTILFEKDLQIQVSKPELMSLRAGVLVMRFSFKDTIETTRISDEDTSKVLFLFVSSL